MSACQEVRPLRVALLTHSTNPRGGVVHAIELADALQALGHQATVVAPDPGHGGLFRTTRCAFEPVPAKHCNGGLAVLVEQRIGEYLDWFAAASTPRYDVYHAQDSISANALAILVERGALPGFVRTVHHLDRFADPRLADWQRRGYRDAAVVLCVSRLWQRELARVHGIAARLVDNGVDTGRFTPGSSLTATADNTLRRSLCLRNGPVYLAVGGIEERKNTVAILQAFLQVRQVRPEAQLLIAGGASLLDHGEYGRRFAAIAAEAGDACGPHGSVKVLGQIADDDMPRLYRLADALVFPSLREGFGLAVLEAMASGTPAVVSRIAPFTEYLDASSCVWADPLDSGSIAAAMLEACVPGTVVRLAAAGRDIVARYSWSRTARQHLDIYQFIDFMKEANHA